MYFLIQWGLWIAFVGVMFLIGWSFGYNEGRADQKEILVRLRKSIDANSKS